MQVVIELDATVHQNAQKYFEAARKQKNKTKGAVQALEETERKLKRARKNEEKQKASGKLNRLKRSKRMWFEQHRWGMVEGGHLLVGGKDAKGNDAVVKKHLSNNDIYLHADLHGAPSCSLRSMQGFPARRTTASSPSRGHSGVQVGGQTSQSGTRRCEVGTSRNPCALLEPGMERWRGSRHRVQRQTRPSIKISTDR